MLSGRMIDSHRWKSIAINDNLILHTVKLRKGMEKNNNVDVADMGVI